MTTTPQAQMLISLKDSEFWPADMSLNKWADLVCDELRRLDAENQRLQAILAKLQPAQEPARKVSEWTEREFCRINGLEVKT